MRFLDKFNPMKFAHPGHAVYNFGGGGQSGGSVVAQVSPAAALQAGQVQASAAGAASDAATTQINNAIAQLTQQYTAANINLNPYSSSGVQAQNQLNQYLGLDAYNPGAAPTNNTMTLDRIKSGITDSAIKNYIAQNSVGGVNEFGQYFGNDIYSGYGNEIGLPGVGIDTHAGDTSYGKLAAPTAQWQSSAQIQDAVRNGLANDQYKQLQASGLISAQQQQYDQQLAAYNQNLAWYNKYSAEGPKTQAQIATEMSNQAGFQAQQQNGIQAIQQAAGAGGYLGSGKVLQQLNSFGSNLLSTYYNNTLNRLQTIAGQGQAAATTQSGNTSNLGNNLASLYNSLGETQANSILAAAQAQASAYQTAGTTYQTVGGSSGGGGSGLGSILGGLGSLATAFKSSEALKDKVAEVNHDDILKGIDNMRVEKWKYKNIDRSFFGPYAEEFAELFGVGNGEDLNMIDIMGVMLSGIKALNTKVESLQQELRHAR